MRVFSRRVALAAALVLALGAAPAASATASEETQFVALVNDARVTAGLGPLSVYADLVDDARRHTGDMISQGTIFHSSNAQLAAATSGWSLLGENVGMGPDPDVLQAAFMASPTHKANILGAFDRVGVGAERAPDGTLFVTVMFMQTTSTPTTQAAPPPPPTTTPTPTPPAPSPGPTAPASETPPPPDETVTATPSTGTPDTATPAAPGLQPVLSQRVPPAEAPPCVVIRHFGSTCMD